MIKFIPLGGADEIGASCFYLNIFGTGILLDCGIHPRKKGKDSLPSFSLLKDEPLDFVFITHAHQDHIGSLPFLLQEYPHAIIYSTYQTKEIAEIVLHNTVNILSMENSADESFRNYTHEEIDLLVRFIRDVEYEKPLELRGLRHNIDEPVKIIFTDAGHIIGSASVIIEIAGEKIIYTGDVNFSNQKIMVGANSKNLSNASILLMETTYGSTDSSKLGTWHSESKRFSKHVNQIINSGGSVLVPVFALGKTQELLATIFSLMKKKNLTDTTIYTGGIGREISNIYDRNRYLVNYSDTELILKNIPQQNLNDISDLNTFVKNPGIVLASSGMMLPGTASYKLTQFWIRQKNFAIYSVGYMDFDTPGYLIMNSKTGEKIILPGNSEPQVIQCGLEKFFFPSHSKREDLLALVQKTNPGMIIMLHGEYSSKDWIGHKILGMNKNIKLHSAEVGKQVLLNKQSNQSDRTV